MALRSVGTDVLSISFEDAGPVNGPVVMLLHGWPDDIRAWHNVAPALHAAGYRTITPYLRGFGGSTFLSSYDVRDGRAVALAQDAIELADLLEIRTFAVAGHDWGARTAYTLAALFPERIMHIVAIAVAYQPRGEFKLPAFPQARRFWYQWFMVLDEGAKAVRKAPIAFARIQWETWSPAGWIDNAEFERTAKSFENPDWVGITLNAYRGRWREEPSDSRYDPLQHRLKTIEKLSTPTLMIQGVSDFCDPPSESEDQKKYFTGGYERVLLEGVGHFPPREAPDAVAQAILTHIKSTNVLRAF